MRKRSMVSEIDLLRKDIPRLEKKFGVDNPFVKVLKAQLALLQNQRKQQLQRVRYHRWLVNFKRLQNFYPPTNNFNPIDSKPH
jgi:hypothetical protein